MKIEVKLFKVKPKPKLPEGLIRATWDVGSRHYSGCGETWREALHSLVDLLLDEDVIV